MEHCVRITAQFGTNDQGDELDVAVLSAVAVKRFSFPGFGGPEPDHENSWFLPAPHERVIIHPQNHHRRYAVGRVRGQWHCGITAFVISVYHTLPPCIPLHERRWRRDFHLKLASSDDS